MNGSLSVFIGFDSSEADAYDICKYSIEKYATQKIDVFPLKQKELRDQGLYTRSIDSKASNEFSMTRWLTPHLSKTQNAIFMDCDMIFTGDICQLLSDLDPQKAVHVVKHDYVPKSATKMKVGETVQQQYAYPRKNWSSFVIWNCAHAAVAQITPDLVNSCEPKDVHRFSFLQDDQIGEIDCWTTVNDGSKEIRVPLVNFLVGEYPRPSELPLMVHYTLGVPGVHENSSDCDYFKEWMDLASEMRLDRRIQQLERFANQSFLATTENYYINTKLALRAAATARKIRIDQDVECSPKTDPCVMRVSTALRGKEILDEETQ